MIEDVEAGSYRLTIMRNGYAKQIYGQRVANGIVPPLEIGEGETKDLVIRLTPAGRTAPGYRPGLQHPRYSTELECWSHQRHHSRSIGPSPGAQVLLVPEKSRHRHQLFRAVTADQNGRFSISNVVPGAYKLFAWETIEPYSWFDAELLGRYEPRGRSINVAEGSRQTIEVRTMSLMP